MSYVHPLLHGCVFFFLSQDCNGPPSTCIWQAGKKPLKRCWFSNAYLSIKHVPYQFTMQRVGSIVFQGQWRAPVRQTQFMDKSTLVGPHHCAKNTCLVLFLINAGLYSSNIYSIQCLLAFMHEWIIIQWICMEHLLCGLQRYASSRGQCQNVWDDPWPQGN